MFNLLENPTSLILALSTIITILFYLREYNLRKKHQQQGERMLEEFREKGLETLHQSIKKSQNIIGSAELEGVRVVADTRFFSSKLEQEYSNKLSEIIRQSEESIKQSQAQLLQFMVDLQKRSQDFEIASQRATQERINQMFESLETKLGQFLISTAQKTTSSIELELKSARQLIETYKQQQLSLIDENILSMMEQTLNIVLGKKLSLKDQLDLIYEALEKAKKDQLVI